MAYAVTFLDTATGAMAEKVFDLEWDREEDDGILFYFSLGNYGCDCNRGYLFDAEDVDCEGHRFEVVGIVLEDGDVLTEVDALEHGWVMNGPWSGRR
jgi:hypothetical protein